MTQEPTQITVVQRKEKSRWEKFQSWVKNEKPSSIRISDRFIDAGLIPFQEQENRDYRLFQLSEILAEIEKELGEIDKGIPTEQFAFKNIKKLFRAFMTIGSPWFRGLDNRELAEKAVAFFELETMVGHLPSFYPDLKLCTETLINLSWQALDMTPPPTVIFEGKKTTVEQPGFMGTIPTSGGAISQTYPSKPKGGPYNKELSSRVE